jgi:hypothetical protein
MRPISAGDKLRMALAPLHVLIGCTLVRRFFTGARTPMVLVLGLLFVAFGLYRVTLIARALRERG